MNEQERHLSAEQIDVLIETSPGAVGTRGDLALLDDARHHLKVCEACQRLVSMHRHCDRILRHLRYEADVEIRDDCPPEKSLYELAAKITDHDTADRILKHVVQCGHCSVVLRRAIEEVGTEPTAHEETLLASLQTSSEDWQKRFAIRLAALNAPAPSEAKDISKSSGNLWQRWKPFPGWRYVYATAAAILVLVVGFWTYGKFTEPPVDRLLARAYSEQRTMELRITGAEHAPLREERGAGVSSLAKPSALLKAEYEIELRLAARPEDAGALAAKGRAELLEWQYTAALASLKYALDLNPDSPELLCDLASAYAQRGDAEKRPLDYGEAIEYLGQALSKKPDDPVFLFNRALVDERLSLFEEATKDWEHYLRVDPKGPWAEEAREHLEALRFKLKQSLAIPLAEHDPQRAIPLLEARAQGEDSDSALWMGSLDEDYLDVAIREWLPSLTKQRPQSASAVYIPEWRALTAVSRILASQHGDPWLRELLANKQSTALFEGWTDLSLAAQRNSRGDFDGAADASSKAVEILMRERCTPGVLRALWEQAYALQRSQQGRQCLRKAKEARRIRNWARYPWLSAQLELEESVCLAMVGQLTLAQEGMRRGLDVAQSAGYGTLVLRGMHMAGVEIAANDPERSWIWFQEGLRRHWAGAYRPFRAYQFYAEMSFTPENRGEWHLARQLMEEAVAHVARTPNHMTEAIARHSLAVDTQLCGDLQEAAGEFSKTSALFSLLPNTPAARTLLFSAEVYQASLEVQQGRSDLALATLTVARHDYAEQSQYRMWQHYYEALGTALLQDGKNDEDAERALRAAVSISEAALATLRTDEERLLWERSAARSYRSLVELKAKRGSDSKQALEIWEWYLAAGIRGSSAKTRAPDIPFEELDAGPALPRLSLAANSLPTLQTVSVISFAELASGTFVWIFDDRGVHEAAIPGSQNEIDKAARRFLRLCSEPHSDTAEIRRVGRQLYDWLIVPIEKHLAPSRVLVIETDGEIGRIPFNVLVTPSGDFLGERFEIVISPGLDFWSRLREPKPFSPSDRTLVVGVSEGQASAGPGLPSLPDAEREAREIARLFPQSIVLLDQNATVDKVERELPAVRVFHFAGHAVASAERNGLVLGAPGAANASGVNNHLVNAAAIESFAMPKLDLVVLSACATGADERGLADPQSLVRVFLRSGAAQVVASRWGVDSASTAQMMKHFYEALAKGSEPPQALKDAEEAVRKQPTTAHPYYWASFGVFGRN